MFEVSSLLVNHLFFRSTPDHTPTWTSLRVYCFGRPRPVLRSTPHHTCVWTSLLFRSVTHHTSVCIILFHTSVWTSPLFRSTPHHTSTWTSLRSTGTRGSGRARAADPVGLGTTRTRESGTNKSPTVNLNGRVEVCKKTGQSFYALLHLYVPPFQ